MSAWQPDGELILDPAVPLEQAARALPARWAVYLMSDADDRPVQLLCVKNLRASVRRRLGESPDALPSKRIDYRAMVRTIRWRRVDSTLESDLAYLDIARRVFPTGYRKVVTLRPTWWLHLNLDSPFPRWVRTDDPTTTGGVLLGPLAERQQAQRLIELIEDTFDLCRYYNILLQSPTGSPCAYKDMHKCPAPCDGSVSMQQYKALVEWSLETLIDPSTEIEEQNDRMRDAAGELRFELAGKIKQFVQSLQGLRAGDYRFVKPIQNFAYATVQPGPAKGKTRLLALTPAGIAEWACLINDPHDIAPGLAAALATLPGARPGVGAIDPEQLSIVAHHLMGSRAGGSGMFLAPEELTPALLTKAHRAVAKQVTEESGDEEGVVREAIGV